MLRSIGASLVVALAFAVLPSQAAEPQQAIVRACAADVDRLCAGVPPGEGRIKACMKAHITELSAPCFDTLLGAVASEKEPK